MYKNDAWGDVFHVVEAVYSDQYTGKQHDVHDDGNDDGFIQRVPYFTLIRRVYRDRDNKSEQQTQQLETVKETLFEKQKQYEDSLEKVAELEESIGNLKSMITDLKKDTKGRKQEIERQVLK